jgi:hypothetical protein
MDVYPFLPLSESLLIERIDPNETRLRMIRFGGVRKTWDRLLLPFDTTSIGIRYTLADINVVFVRWDMSANVYWTFTLAYLLTHAQHAAEYATQFGKMGKLNRFSSLLKAFLRS